ncbi:hypothetical protein BLA29_010243, partial [Euroglyphus maynei]
MYKFDKGNHHRLFLKGSREDDDPDNIADSNANNNHLINDHTIDREQYDFDSKNHMASASQETRELFRTTNNRAGLKTVQTKRVAKKITTVNRGEQRKL